MPKVKQDCLVEFDEITKKAQEASGWSKEDMAYTVAKLINGAGKLAKILANAMESMSESFTEESPATTRDLSDISRSLQAVTIALQNYSTIYTWCDATGKTGKEDDNALEKVLDVLNPQEMKLFYSWLARTEARV